MNPRDKDYIEARLREAMVALDGATDRLMTNGLKTPQSETVRRLADQVLTLLLFLHTV